MSAEPERRLVTVLVTDIADSTRLAEKLGAERYKILFDEIARITREQVERFGGTVAQHTGDGVLALFGAPTAHEDDSERAVRAALAVHEALGRFATEVDEAYGIAVAARAAVNTGPALVLRGDEPPDQLYNALGDTATVAARLQSHAVSGGTVVGPLTAHQVGARFELEPLGALELKGRSEPVEAFHVVGQAEQTSTPALTPLVGRDAELDRLVGALADLADGRGMVAVITGEPGIGKSRLVAEAHARLDGGIRFAEGAAVAYAETFPYWPVRAALRDWLDLGAGAPDAQVRLELKTALARVLPDRADAYPFLASIVGAPLDVAEMTTLDGLTPDSVQRQTYEAVRQLVLALAGDRPLCFVFDDLHWADESTLDLIDDLLDTTEEEAVGFLLLMRSERDHRSWHLGEHARQRLPHRLTEIGLHALDTDMSRSLVNGAAAAPLPKEVEDLLAERAGGNPFFLEEALRDLVEQGALRRSNGSYTLAVEADRLAVPSIVQEALQARLDRLAPLTRQLVGAASVVGRSFGTTLLERLLPGERLAPLLGELQRLDLVVEERRRPTPEYRFRHGLVQEVAYAGLAERQRHELHRRTAVALEEIHGAAADEIAGLLAHHYAEGDEPVSAARWFERAGDAARAQYANDEAVAHYERAVALYDEIDDGNGARHVLFKIGIGHVQAFEFPRAAAAYRNAFSRRVEQERPAPPTERVRVPVQRSDSIVPGLGYFAVSWWIMANIYRGLLRVDEDMTVVPEVAETFELSDDGTTYRFVLRGDVYWHDGIPVTATDFVWTWERMRSQDVRTAFLLDPIGSARAIDDRTLELTLNAPSNTFLYILGWPPSYPWPSHLGGTPNERDDRLIGNGPFELAEIGEAGLRLTAAPRWPLPRGNVSNADLVYATPDSEIEAWLDGDFDISPVALFSPALAEDEFVVVNAVAYAHYTLKSDAPPFDDVRIRKAVACALDREQLLVGHGSRLLDIPNKRGGLIPPLLPGHEHDVGIGYEPERARALLAEAGHPNGEGIDEIVVVVFDFLPEPVVEELRRQLAAIGIASRIEPVPFDEYEQAIRTRGNMYLYAWTPDVPDPSSVFDPHFTLYTHVFRDEALVELLERARAETDRDERLRLYREIDRTVVAEHASIVPVSYRRSVTLRRGWISGFWANGYFQSALDEVVVDAERRDRLTR